MPDEASTKRTYIAFLLDQSGSMASIRQQAIDGFNEQVGIIQRDADKGGDTWVSLYKFGGGDGTKPYWERTFDALAPTALHRLNPDTYVPNGITPMYDCVGMALQDLGPKDEAGDIGFLVVIVSDGRENASQEWTAERIADKVKELEATGRWTFVYIGANQNLADVQKHLGIKQVVAFAATPTGYQYMSENMAGSTESYLSARSKGETSTPEYWTESKTPDQEPKK
jgi:Mg-chelatase subunit ChlD